MKLYVIKKYIDGGPNDIGSKLGYVEADSPIEAKKKFAKGKRNYNDIVNTGFYQAHQITRSQYLKESSEDELYARALLKSTKLIK